MPPTSDEVRRALPAIRRAIAEIARLIDDKIASGQRGAPRAPRTSLQEARAAVSQLVERVNAVFRLVEALDACEPVAMPDDRRPGWQHRN